MKSRSQKVFCFVTLATAFLCLQGPLVADETPVEKSNPEAEILYLKGKSAALDGKYRQAASYFEQALKKDANSPSILNQLSEVYLKLGDNDRAIELGKRAVELDPKNESYHSSLASVYASAKQYNEARTFYKKALELNPTDRKLPLLLGIVEAELGNLDDSIEVFSTFIKENPDRETGYFYRARIYLEKDDIEKAKKDLASALNLRPSFVEAGLTLGMLHERLGEIEEAINVYRKIDGGGRYKKRLAQLYLQQKKYKEALQQLVEYEASEPDDFTAKVKIGLIYFELKDYVNAAKKFNAILKEEPKSDNVRFYLGAVYEEDGKTDKAIAEYKKVSSESSFFAQAVLHVGFLLKDKKKIKEGISYSRGIVKKNPDVPEFYDMYASFHEAAKEYNKALDVIQNGLKRHPANEKLMYFEGAMYDKLGKRDQGIENMKAILKINDNNAHALNFLGYTYAEMGKNLDEAEELISRALKLRPNDGFIEDSLGWVLFKKGKVEQALERLRKAKELQPEEAVIYDHLGDVYAHKKEFDRAQEMYQKAIEFSADRDKELSSKVKGKLAALKTDERTPSTEKKKD